jgi:FtsZ-interacting cell division protein YlmF
MEELLVEKPGLFSRLRDMFHRHEGSEAVEALEAPAQSQASSATTYRPTYRYTVTIRRQVTSYDDAYAVGHGLKRGEQQIVNLSMVEPVTRQNIVQFLSGVNFALEGHWEEIGENIYLIAPATAYLEVAPPSPRSQSARN